MTRFIALEVTSIVLNPKPSDILPTVELEFNFTTKTKVNSEKKLLSIVANVTILRKRTREDLSSITTVSTFEIGNFDDAVAQAKDLTHKVNVDLDKRLTVISIHTLRGLMFSLLSNTYLKKALIPIIEEEMLKRPPQ